MSDTEEDYGWGDEPEEDIDIDVCQGCGAYYEYTKRNRELWIQTVWDKKPEGKVQPQLCNHCMIK